MVGEKFNLTAEVDMTSGRKYQDRGNRVDFGTCRTCGFDGFKESLAHVRHTYHDSCKKKETWKEIPLQGWERMSRL